MNPAREQQVAHLADLMQSVLADLRTPLPEEWLDLELTMPQLRVLLFLTHGPRRMGDCATHLGCSLSSATSILDRLVKKRLVARVSDPADRRVVLCRLTPRGREGTEQFLRLGRKRLESLAGLLMPEELEMVISAMEMLAAAAQGVNAGRLSPAGRSPASSTAS